ncbi:WD40/YVTN/BNR-like repeat-containing protein, partial [Planctomycetota bacterium]
FYPYDMAISKSNPSVMYISGYKQVDNQYFAALLTTSDGGNTWTDISNAVETESYLIFTSVVIDPTDDGKVYVGGDYFYRGTKTGRDPDLSWTRSRTTYYIYSIGIDPVEPSRIYLGLYESIATSMDSGRSWNIQNNTIKRSADHIAVAPADPSKVYVSCYAGFYKSSDFGTNWDTSHEGIYAARINAMAVDPRLILVQNSGYLMSFGRGRNNIWEDVVTPPSCGEVCDILINPDNPNTVLILEGYG